MSPGCCGSSWLTAPVNKWDRFAAFRRCGCAGVAPRLATVMGSLLSITLMPFQSKKVLCRTNGWCQRQTVCWFGCFALGNLKGWEGCDVGCGVKALESERWQKGMQGAEGPRGCREQCKIKKLSVMVGVTAQRRLSDEISLVCHTPAGMKTCLKEFWSNPPPSEGDSRD